jgi:phosphate transport system substrate-binding protein
VSETVDAIGFFGVAYYIQSQDRLKAVQIVNPKTGKAVAPTVEAIESGDYAPLSRPLFIYVNAKSVTRPEVKVFVQHYLERAAELAKSVGYVPLPDEAYARAKEVLRSRKTGTSYLDAEGNAKHGPILDVYTSANIAD